MRGGADDETDALEWLKVKLAALASSGEKLLLFAHHKHVVTALSTFLSDFSSFAVLVTSSSSRL